MSSSEVRPRHWLQFSLRTLFVLMLVVAAFFGGRESMRPVIQAERTRAVESRAQAEMQRAQALAHAAQIQALSAATQAEVARVLARRKEKEFEAQLLLHLQQIKAAEQQFKDAPATERGSPDSSAMP